MHDIIRGDVEFANDLIEDFIVVRSTGVVLYPLANATDDRHDRSPTSSVAKSISPTRPSR